MRKFFACSGTLMLIFGCILTALFLKSFENFSGSMTNLAFRSWPVSLTPTLKPHGLIRSSEEKIANPQLFVETKPDIEARQTSPKYTLKYFMTDWCTFCKAMTPVINEMAEKFKDRLVVETIDLDKNKAEGTKYGIRAVPTLILLDENNNIIENGRLDGGQTKENLLNWFEWFEINLQH